MNGTQTQNCSERIVIYDYIRIFATLLVVLGHSTYTEWNGDLGNVVVNISKFNPIWFTPIWQSFLGNFGSWIYTFHMPLFFALSGAVYAISNNQNKSLDETVVKKIKRLIIPYYLVGLLYMLPIKLLTGFYHRGTFVSAVSVFLSAKGAMAHLWFLPAVFWCFIVMWGIEKLFAKKNIFATLLLAAAIQLIASRYLGALNFFCFQVGLTYFFFFALGYAFELYRKSNRAIETSWKMAFVVLLVCIFLSSYKNMTLLKSSSKIVNVLLGSLIILSISVLLNGLTRLHEKKWFKFLVDNCYYIYLFHEPLNYITLKFAEQFIGSVSGCIFYEFSRTIGVILVSLVIGQIVDRLFKPLIKESKGFLFAREV